MINFKSCGYGSLTAPIPDDDRDIVEPAEERRHRTRQLPTRILFATVLVVLVVSFSFVYLTNENDLNLEDGSMSLAALRGVPPSSISSMNRSFESLPEFSNLTWHLPPRSAGESLDNEHYVGYLLLCDTVSITGVKGLVYQDLNPHFLDTHDSLNDTACPPPTSDMVSPVIRMTPGIKYTLVLINESSEPTNVHLHGLHVSGVGMVDDITRIVESGDCLVYEYMIRDDADVGTFLYHSHLHPIAAHQVFAGAYGLLVVDETPQIMSTFYPSHLQSFFHNEVMFQYVSVLDKATGDRTNILNGLFQNTSGDPAVMSVNLIQNEWYYFRVSFNVLSDAENYVEFDPPNACEVRVVAYDGVYRSTIPSSFSSSRHMLTLASRVDLAVKCSAPRVGLHFHQGEMTNRTRLVDIETVQVEQNATEESSPYWDPQAESQWAPRRPYYMADLRKMENPEGGIDYWTVSMENFLSNGTKAFAISQGRWDPDKPLRTLKLGQLCEWSLDNSMTHPFHLHVNRMQIVESGGCGLRFEEGEYFDTITSNLDSCRVRIWFRDFAGRIVGHCHKLKHEDKKMMVWFNVTGGNGEGVLAYPSQTCSDIHLK
eukprot:Nitzschia sp. Nitz4//scaffold90_size81538//42510//44300//NITZ4_005321-RA/size81538-processed-gene-0.35-mRNA-1//1//CDS//3329560017//7319//frame0